MSRLLSEIEIEYILNLAEDNFIYSAPEVVNYCYTIIFECLILSMKFIPENEWYTHISKYLSR